MDSWLNSTYVSVAKTCEGDIFVRRPHHPIGGVYSVTTYPRGRRRAAGTARDCRRMRRVGSWMEWRPQNRRVTLTSCMDNMRTNTRTTWALSHAMWCALSEYDENTNKKENYVHIHLSGVAFHVLCVGLGFHVVIGVGRLVIRFHHAYAMTSFSSCCSPTLSCRRQFKL